MNGDNPFWPQTQSVPLLLTLDARSISVLDGEEREQAEFLCELCVTPAVDGLWTWGAHPISDGLPRTELRLRHSGSDNRAVGVVGQEGFVGGVAMWSSHERLADEIYGLRGAARDWFVYYSTTTTFHRNAQRHVYVTADRRLLGELRSGRRQAFWQRGRVVSVQAALLLAGRAMRASGQIYYRADQGCRTWTTPHSLYFHLGPDLAPSRVRVHRWNGSRNHAESGEIYALERSVHDRVVDLLKARDHIALQNVREQNNATLDEALYHLRAAIGSAAALFDSLASLAQIALEVEPSGAGGKGGITLNDRAFRRALKRSGATGTATAASEIVPLLDLVWSLRNVIMHGAGLSGATFARDAKPGASESRVNLTAEQVARLEALVQHRRETCDQWGAHAFGTQIQVEPERFGSRFCLVSIEAAERVTRALADDLAAPALEIVGRREVDVEMLRRFRWLAGLPTQGVVAD